MGGCIDYSFRVPHSSGAPLLTRVVQLAQGTRPKAQGQVKEDARLPPEMLQGLACNSRPEQVSVVIV